MAAPLRVLTEFERSDRLMLIGFRSRDMTISKRNSFRSFLLAGGLILAGAGVSQADYNAGTAAFNAGNYTRAYQEYKQAADAGNSLAQFMMGRLYAEGRGVVEDKVAAYMWFDLAASNGNSRAIGVRDAVAAQMDSADIDRAQDLAAEWRANRPAIGSGNTATVAPSMPAAPSAAPYSLRNVQVALSNLGYSVGTPDGVIGPKSRAAIRAYQVDSGLPASGEPSIALYDKLQASIAQRSAQAKPAQPVTPAVDAAMIREVQSELRRRGYAISAISGTVNAETVAAVRAYQADARLAVTGAVDDALLRQLGTARADSGAIYRAQVKQVQAALNAAGYSAGPADGALGPKSRAAISRYQSDNSLAATGDVNAELLAGLGIASDEQGTTTSVSAATIRETKHELQSHGYPSGNLNGTLDTATREAIRAYQSDAGLVVTGEATPELLDHLRQSDIRYGGDADSQVVLNIEDQLQRHGYTVGPVDGVIDVRTRGAIRAYQADAGLAITGEADDPLLAHLQTSDIKPLPNSALVEVQYILNRLGYLNAQSDGVMGPKSTAAIRRYQGDRGLAITGVPSMELLTKLRAEKIMEPGANFKSD
jgi:peptidoglycan hydrolase-like protein with peptidoglycan-binding domain